MLGLHRLDGEDSTGKNILAVAKDWIELEERRRTFWATFYGDRWASSGTGWPMVIDDDDVSEMRSSHDVYLMCGSRSPQICLRLRRLLRAA